MSHWNPHSKFDYQEWLRQQIAKPGESGAGDRDVAFAEKHADTPLNELAHYRRQADMLQRTGTLRGGWRRVC